MNKRLIAVTIIFLGLILITPFVYDHNLDKNEGNRIPSYLSSYPDVGYFKIKPETILVSLDEGNSDVFTPLVEDPRLVESLINVSFSWTQSNILKIVKTLGQLVWSDTMDLDHWSVYDLYLRKSCEDNPKGFDFASITYFRVVDVNGKKVYVTRHIEIDPYYSMVRWGSGATYSQPILHKWKGFDLAGSAITAENALRISEEHGGKEARLKVNNKCLIQVSPSKNNDKWAVYYIPPADFFMQVDLYTGEYKTEVTR